MKPEQYWIGRGANVIGIDALSDGARQAATYQAIADWLIARRVADVLDVGCNIAVLAHFLHRAGFSGHYHGVDTNPHALRVASGRGENVEQGDLRRLSFLGKAYQAVIVKDVIEHLESPESLREAFCVAYEYVVVSTYLPWTDAPAAIVRHADGYYTNRYCAADITALARRCGFVLMETLIVSETTGEPNQVTFWQRTR